MRDSLIMFFKSHPKLIMKVWALIRYFMTIWSWFVPVRPKTIIFNSFGGRSFNDSPKALYDEICRRKEFEDWTLIWAFVEPEKFEIPRGAKVKIDTYSFFKALLYSRVWIGNSDTDRGIGLKLKKHIRVDTWHGTPLKKIGGEEHTETFAVKPEDYKGPIDGDTIRCAQSPFDAEIFARIFHATKDSFLMCDLPRNDELLRYNEIDIDRIKNTLGINTSKKIILYTPTYREYLVNSNNENFIAPPIDLNKWEEKLGDRYVLLIRAHYAVAAALDIKENEFVKDVSKYQSINDLYAISDMMISDYSSTYFDYSILDRPMFCFAYDLDEYEEKRGLYLNIKEELPCAIDDNEDSLINRISSLNYEAATERTKLFHQRFAPRAGNACPIVVDKIMSRL